jgi:hypothetical protein
MRINTKGSGQGNRTFVGNINFFEYPEKPLRILKQAIFILNSNIKGMKPCNECFSALPGGRSFDDVLMDNSVWVSYEPSRTVDWYGIYLSATNEICVSQAAFDIGRWMVASTLVHELAHVNGASGYTDEAERTLLRCGLRRLYDKDVVG